MSEQNKDVVRRVVDDHWNKKNPDLVSELFAPDMTLETPDGVLSGHEGAHALLNAYRTAFPDFHLATEDLVADGNRVAIRWTFTGTNTGPLAGIAPTGNKVSVSRNLGIFQVDGGKITGGQLNWNKYNLLQQLGAIPS